MAEISKDNIVTTDERFPSNDYTRITPREPSSPKKQKDETPKKPKAKEKKKTFGERIADNFLNLDYDKLKEHLLFDWLFPEVIATFDDILRVIFFGDRNGGPRRRRRDRDSGRYISYGKISDDRGDDEYRRRQDPTRQNFKHIRLVYFDQESGLDDMAELRDRLRESERGYVTVRELYTVAGLPTNSTMFNWGWYDLEDMDLVRDGDDWILEMPKAEVIK